MDPLLHLLLKNVARNQKIVATDLKQGKLVHRLLHFGKWTFFNLSYIFYWIHINLAPWIRIQVIKLYKIDKKKLAEITRKNMIIFPFLIKTFKYKSEKSNSCSKDKEMKKKLKFFYFIFFLRKNFRYVNKKPGSGST